MYSALPALVSILFLLFGLFVVNQKGINRISSSFLMLYVTTFFWQFTWAALFQAKDPDTANQLIKIGWLLILILPTSLYHFSCEITGVRSDLKYVFLSYCMSLFLAAVMIASNKIIDGSHLYFWGYYPKAGDYLWLHILQTSVVVVRSIFNTYKRYLATRGEEKDRILYCFFGILVYSLAAVDYLCNYGFEFYPPGVLFITVSLGIIAVALVRFQLVDSVRTIASSLAHEMRTPMATVKLHAQILSNYLPTLVEGYQMAVAHQLLSKKLDAKTLDGLNELAKNIEREITRGNQAIDMLLAVTSNLELDKRDYKPFSVGHCVKEIIKKYPFEVEAYTSIELECEGDFFIHGSETLFGFVLLNLIKNSLYAIKEKGSGGIHFSIRPGVIEVKDSGIGIPPSVLPHIFENFYTTKPRNSNSGVGLAFCKRVIESFDGRISCHSIHSIGTTFTMTFSSKPLVPSTVSQ